jgi:hypothetical protein
MVGILREVDHGPFVLLALHQQIAADIHGDGFAFDISPGNRRYLVDKRRNWKFTLGDGQTCLNELSHFW